MLELITQAAVHPFGIFVILVGAAIGGSDERMRTKIPYFEMIAGALFGNSIALMQVHGGGAEYRDVVLPFAGVFSIICTVGGLLGWTLRRLIKNR